MLCTQQDTPAATRLQPCDHSRREILAKNRYFADGQQRKGLRRAFCSRFGDRTEIQRACAPVSGGPFSLKAVQSISNGCEGCWREDTSLAEFLQLCAANPPLLSADPPVRPLGVPLLGA